MQGTANTTLFSSSRHTDTAWQPDHPEHTLCIRYREHEAQHLNFMYFYGPSCVDATDQAAFNWDRWNEYQAELARQEAAAYETFLKQVEAAKRGELVPAPVAAVTRVQWQAVPKAPPKRCVLFHLGGFCW